MLNPAMWQPEGLTEGARLSARAMLASLAPLHRSLRERSPSPFRGGFE
jgi:hypothetical protein